MLTSLFYYLTLIAKDLKSYHHSQYDLHPLSTFDIMDKSEWHPNIHYYKEGYDFGMAIYCKQLDLTDQNPHTKEKSNESI